MIVIMGMIMVVVVSLARAVTIGTVIAAVARVARAVAARVGRRANITRVVGTVELMIIMMARLKNHLRDEDTYEQ
jgi:hypothetical protein